ncbi:MAG: phage baseplate assembly protein V [Nodosilinea sp.]
MTSDYEQMMVELLEFKRSHHFGKYRGKVSDVDDPEGLGRLKASMEIWGGQESSWAWPAVPFAGPGHGLVLLPEVGDGVWIEFEAGKPDRPIWTGCWWARGELPDPGGTKTRALVTSSGHRLVLDDGNNQVQLLHAGGAELTMTNTDITLKIGATQVVLSASGVNINNGAFQVR